MAYSLRESSVPSHLLLQKQYDELETVFNDFIDCNIDENRENLEYLKVMANKCKEIFNNLSDVSYKLIKYEIDCGSMSNASKLRGKRIEFKKETSSFIDIINGYLDNSHISFDIDSTRSKSPANDVSFAPSHCSSPVDQYHDAPGGAHQSSVALESNQNIVKFSEPSFKYFNSNLESMCKIPHTEPSTSLTVGRPSDFSSVSQFATPHLPLSAPALVDVSPTEFQSIDGAKEISVVHPVAYHFSSGIPAPTKKCLSTLDAAPHAEPASVHNNATLDAAFLSSAEALNLNATRPPVSRLPSNLPTLASRQTDADYQSSRDALAQLPIKGLNYFQDNTAARQSSAAPPTIGTSIANSISLHTVSGQYNSTGAIPPISVPQLSPTNNVRISSQVPISSGVPYQPSYNHADIGTQSTASRQAPPLPNSQTYLPSHNFPAGISTQPAVSLPAPYSASTYVPSAHAHRPHAGIAAHNSPSDILTQHIVRNQLYQKLGEPFNGDPQKYHAWVNIMQRKMSNLNLDPWDILSILYENTSGNARKLLENFIYIGAVNPQRTLNDAWNALYEHFGTGSRIASSIVKKIETFAPIKSIHYHEKLGELVNICRVIQVNIPAAIELQVYNLPSGMRQIWLKLPDALQNGWRSFSADYKVSNYGNTPTLAHFTSYLERKYAELSDPSFEKPIPSYISNRPISSTTLKSLENRPLAEYSPRFHSKSDDICPLHPNGIHSLIHCNAFKKRVHSEKIAIIREHNKCFNCLGPHFIRNCDSSATCDICEKKHATILHDDSRNCENENPSGDFESNDRNYNNATSNLCTAVCGGDTGKSCSKILLVDVTFPSQCSKTMRCYVILDEQSTTSFIDSKVANFFNIVDQPSRQYDLRTLSGLRTSNVGMEISGLKIRGVGQKKVISLPTVLTTSTIPASKHEVATPGIVSQHNHIRHLAKNFANYDGNAEVLMLIGRDCGPAMSTRCFGYRAPYAHRTPIGWALVGLVCKNTSIASERSVLKVQVLKTTREHWDIKPSPFEPEPETRPYSLRNLFSELPDDELEGLSRDDTNFIHKISSNIRVNDEGNLSMPLPFKQNQVNLPNNRAPVYCRMVNTLNKIKNDPAKLEQCLINMKTNIDRNHIEQVPRNELVAVPGKVWYLPIFTVEHPKKKKIRIVWDSKASYHGVSLNNQLLSGPDVNTQLTTVLLRFRQGEIAFTGDIESMFYSFHLEPRDCDFTRFFWWKNNNPESNIVEYRAKRHIFGNTSSPALANLGLRFAILNSDHTSERARNFVFKNFYVDDGCGSANSVQEAIDVLKETRKSLLSFNIRLHKLTSNSPEVLTAFPVSELGETASQDFNHSMAQRTLGVEWNPASDMFVVRADVPHKPFTKRGTLATTNSFFDPLGFASPIILKGRLLQRLLIPPKTGDPEVVKLGWDDPLPSRHYNLWKEFTDSLRQNDRFLTVSRCFRPSGFGRVSETTLHVFSDASVEGTGYVMYLRSVNAENLIHVSFVSANSRVSPRNTLSIPRLELCAALDASVAAIKICNDLNLEFASVKLYSDSKVVIGYLNNTSRRFSRYVARRVQLILKPFSSHQWSYVPTHENPGDLASRPQTFESLSKSCWFRGPAFLWDSLLPEFKEYEEVNLPEIREEEKTLISTENPPSVLSSLFQRVSSWSKLVNVVKLVTRFIITLSEKTMHRKGKLLAHQSGDTTKLAKRLIFSSVQRSSFPQVFANVHQPGDLTDLSPILDNDILVRVGGRLQHGKFPENIKHPLLLPGNHPVTTLIIRHFHSIVRHQGRFITLGKIRQEGFYIRHATSSVKKFIRNCVICKKLRGNSLVQKMADLPFDRVYESPPFTFCGLDVFGPFHVREGVSTRRNNRTLKVWALIFICLVTKAVHIETLSQMDISSFKLALRRFFSVRGNCIRLRSDRGTNFIGAHNQDINPASVKDELSSFQCEWEFNPPHSSHFGGVWERAIRSIRKIIDASMLILGKRTLSKEELHTFFCEATCIVNNTPMYEVSGDPNDELPITPAQLLTLKDPSNPPPLESFSEKDILAYGRRRWRRIQALSDHFWSKWRNEYLQELQRRQKWTVQKLNLSPGDLVLLKVENTRRNVWPLAKVETIKVSSDNLVRSVTISVPSSNGGSLKLFDRPIKDLVPILQRFEAFRSE